jgi:hypothetical protein
LTAYFYARCYDMKGARTPVILFTGDEGFRDTLPASELTDHFGGLPEGVDAKTVFAELKKKFKGNVFVLFPTFTSSYDAATNRENLNRWRKVLGEENVVSLDSKVAIADVTLGIIAIASGSRTLEEYIQDIKNRPLEMDGVKYAAQSPERLEEVRRSLEAFAASRKALKGKTRRTPATGGTSKTAKSKTSAAGGASKPGSIL